MNHSSKLICLLIVNALLLFSYSVQANSLTLAPALGLIKADTNQHNLKFMLTNKSSTITSLSIQLAGRDSSEFNFNHNCGAELAINAACTINVTYNRANTRTQSNIIAELWIRTQGSISARALITSSESIDNQAARRLPDVLNILTIPSLFAGSPTTIEWSLLGYQDQVYSQIVVFECNQTQIDNGSCGNQYSNRTAASEILSPNSSQNTNWSYQGKMAKQNNFSWTYTPSKSGAVVFRFYQKNALDKDAGNAGLSLLVPGGLTNVGNNFTYFDTIGRRIKAVVQ